MSTPKFYPKSTEYAKDNDNLRLDYNYDSLEVVKNKIDTEIIWIQDINTELECAENITLTLQQAKWLIKELSNMIKLIEE